MLSIILTHLLIAVAMGLGLAIVPLVQRAARSLIARRDRFERELNTRRWDYWNALANVAAMRETPARRRTPMPRRADHPNRDPRFLIEKEEHTC